MKIDCEQHGSQPWSGQVVCARSVGGCGRFWHLGEKDKQPAEKHGSDCVCGRPLHADEPGCTARPVCAMCFERNLEGT